MKSIILLVSVLLFLAEWYVIRKTSINKFAPIVVLAVIGVPVGSVIGLHLVAFPILLTLLALVLCMLEDLWCKRKGLSEMEKAKLMDE
ncbi:hypothetical protein [Bifidobacterium subtile]|uniref:Uncharacterized protein n=1 Tax=Bifidobacterium subtile TaxID=77635 RepID=A0A087E0Q2_9BIFI|nr:hypothetical protein [Bifidobacterium subtile]KFJ01353.1 hypothetical protein BISU_1912 [Bifidobacterium subtile]QOL37303.1 hypothetical protein BS3272_05280 [Bifidobacterium subtile]